MKTKTLLASIAVASLAIAQPASAATRSADSLPQSRAGTASNVERVGSLTGESEELGNQFLIIFALFALIGVIILASSGGKSPG